MERFDHERLDAYRVALEFTAFVGDLKLHRKRGAADLPDQLLRAAASVCLNIAEGAGEYARGDKARFYRMALRSATECAATLDVLRKLRLADADQTCKGRELLIRVVSMLTRLAQQQRSR